MPYFKQQEIGFGAIEIKGQKSMLPHFFFKKINKFGMGFTAYLL